MNYLKSKISEAKVEQIKCFEYKCNQILSEQFILDHIKKDNKLLDKYEKFNLRAEILNDPNKRQCTEKNCDKYLTKSKNMLNVKMDINFVLNVLGLGMVMILVKNLWKKIF